MGLAMSGNISANKYQKIRHFILNRKEKYIPDRFRVFVYFLKNHTPRFSSGMAIMKIGENGGSDFIVGEVGLPPFGYCITSPVGKYKSLAEIEGLYEISWFSRFSYNEWVKVQLRIPSRNTDMPSPLDYRDKEGNE